ncbi:Hypothetical protein CINCED_3A006874 [Cinara cedri]|uniref:Regulatory protein zeste n=1 Tax=Cinara cedri TaxID=506608 RepID=A0A5E4M1W6_9HEMI|nr:Hypothetical protein CINCED_3A006874 [Cinara cedri]
MDIKRIRKPNITEKQKQLLVDFAVLHPELVSGKNISNTTVKERQNLWKKISSALNYEVGPKKSWSEWRKTWCDIKTNTKTKAWRFWKKRNKTGDDENTLELFSELDNKILKLISPKNIEGHNTVTENGAMTSLVSHFQTTDANTNTEVDNCVMVNNIQNACRDKSGLSGINDLVFQTNNINTSNVVDDNCTNDQPLPSTSKVSNRNVHKGKKNNRRTTLHNAVAAIKSFAVISQKKMKIKADYYEKKLLLLERAVVTKEKQADMLISIVRTLASRPNV